jgi:serine/threonine protein phosphatase PrpC
VNDRVIAFGTAGKFAPRTIYPTGGDMENDRALARRIETWLARPVRENGINDATEAGGVLATTIGERARNEDRVAIVRYSVQTRADVRGFTLFIVCDGMGGMKAGAECAAMAIASTTEYLAAVMTDISEGHLPGGAALLAAISYANEAVHSVFKGAGGTTLTSVIQLQHGPLYMGHVGDSRLASVQASGLLPRSRIDTVRGHLSAIHNLHHAETSDVPYAEGLLQYVGIGRELEPQVTHLASAADVILLYTDGFGESLGDRIAPIVAHSPNAVDACKRLITVSRWAGTRDNASFVCVLPGKWRAPSSVIGRAQVEIWDGHAKLELQPDILSLAARLRPNSPVARLPQFERPGREKVALAGRGGGAAVDRSNQSSQTKRKGKAGKVKGRTKRTTEGTKAPQKELDIQIYPGNEDDA